MLATNVAPAPRLPCYCRYWGDVVKWGSSHRVESAGECCQACTDFKPASKDDVECNGAALGSGELGPGGCASRLWARAHSPEHPFAAIPFCAVWVWCGDEELCEGQYKECWLKHLVRQPGGASRVAACY